MENNRSKRVAKIIIISVVSLLVITSAILLSMKLFQFKKGDLSRYEWVEELCNSMDISTYTSSMPFFEDVETDNQYFDVIQSAVEWDVIPITKNFKGEEYATGKFVAVSGLRSVGEDKIRSVLENDEILDDDKYLELAYKYNIISKKEERRGLSAERCEEIIDKIKNLYYGDLWKKDYCNVKYRDDVVRVSDEDIIGYDSKYTNVTISEHVNVTVGSVIVFEDKEKHIAIAGRIEDIVGQGRYSLSPVELNDVVEYLTISDIVELTSTEIFASNRYEIEPQSIETSFIYDSSPFISQGFKVCMETEEIDDDKWLKLSIIDNATSLKGRDIYIHELDGADNFSGEINISKIILGAEVDYSVIQGLKKADIAIDVMSEFKGEIKSSYEQRINLFDTIVPIAGGIAGVRVKLNMLVGIDGSISFEAEVPAGLDISYTQDKGIRSISKNIELQNEKVSMNCSAELMGEIEGLLEVFNCINIMDAEIGVGAVGNAEIVARPTGQICADVDIKAPIVKMQLCGDDEADSLLSSIIDTSDWEVAFEEKAKELHKHHEEYSDGSSADVQECTYNENAVVPDIEENVDKERTSLSDIELTNTYVTRYGEIHSVTCPTFEFSYPDNWKIVEENYESEGRIEEQVVLENENGSQIIYMAYITSFGYSERIMMRGEKEKVADAQFVASYPDGTDKDMSYLNPFVVAGVRITGVLDMGIDDDYREVDGNSHVYYAVIPEEALGEFQDVAGTDELYENLSFKYPQPYMFVAKPSVGDWEPEEVEEVIAILSSFRAK